MSQLVSVQEYLDRMSAEIGRSMLEAHGIDAHVQGDDMGGTRPDFLSAGRVRVLVRAEDEAEARELLAAAEQSSDDHDEPDTKVVRPEYTKRVTRGFFAAVLGLIILPPVLMHIYALFQLVPALKDWGQFTGSEKAKAVVGLLLSVAVLCAAGIFLPQLDW